MYIERGVFFIQYEIHDQFFTVLIWAWIEKTNLT